LLDGKRAALANGPAAREQGVTAMPFKAIAFVVIVGLSILLVAGLHRENRADAAAGNCY
jgi:hypothetical protein